MSFLGSIFSTVANVAGSLFGLGGGVGSSIGKLVGNVAGGLNSVLNDFSGSLSKLLGSGLGTAFSSISSVLGGITNLLTPIENTLQTVLSPIQKFVSQTASLVSGINTDFIQPLVQPISQTYSSINNLVTVLHTDLSKGISGLIALPQDLSNALTSVDAAFSRAVTGLGEQNTTLAKEVFQPSIDKITTVGLEGATKAIVGLTPEPYKGIAAFPEIKLTEPQAMTGVLEDVSKWVANLQTKTGWVADIARWAVDLLKFGEFIIQQVTPAMRENMQNINQATPNDLLDTGSLVRAYWRGEITADDARAEASKQGLDAAKMDVLINLEAWLPGVRETYELYYRHQIDLATLEATLKKRGLSDADIKATNAAFLEPVNPREWIVWKARQDAANAGFLTATLEAGAPQELRDTYAARFMQADIANFDWTNHWRVPGIDFWLTLYYRGVVDRTRLGLAAQANMVPTEIVDDLITEFGETIQQWMIPDIIAANIMSEAEALSYCQYIGMGERDAKVLVKYGISKQKAPAASTAADLATISLGNAKTMYDDGIIDAATYQQILEDHKYSPQAALLTVQVADVANELKARTATATGIVAQVKAGTLDQATALAQLYKLNYSAGEVAKYTNQIEAAQKANNKFPTYADLEKFLKAGLLTETQWRDAMNVIGWQEPWVSMFYTTIVG